MKNRKGFTIVELVIVIAVIAILAAVLIPTFSGVIGKANESSALQTARSTLTNALNMSSTAQLTGHDTNGYHTYFLIDGYAYGYSGNELVGVNYPTSTTLLKKGASYNRDSKLWTNDFNTIIIAADNLTGDTTLALDDTIIAIIKDATDIDDVDNVTKVGDTYYLNYTEAVGTPGDAGYQPASHDAVILLNSDFSKKIVVFTSFNY